jgi:hypothetical protein
MDTITPPLSAETESNVIRTTMRVQTIYAVYSKIMLSKQEGKEITVDEACDELGISKATFYRWIHEEEESLHTFKALLDGISRNQLALLSTVQERILVSTIQDGLAATTSPKDRLEILKWITERMGDLGRDLRVETDHHAHDFLTGPVLQKAKSKVATLTVGSDGNFSIDIFKEQDIIDLESREASYPLDDESNPKVTAKDLGYQEEYTPAPKQLPHP